MSSVSNVNDSSLFREQKLPENFADEIVSLPHRYAFGDEVRVYRQTKRRLSTAGGLGLDHNLLDHGSSPAVCRLHKRSLTK
jgi:hypothetical protein